MVEELVGLNKAGVALLMAVSLWTIRSTAGLPAEQVSCAMSCSVGMAVYTSHPCLKHCTCRCARV